MYQLGDKAKQAISKNLGIPYEKLIKMTPQEVEAHIEKMNGTKLTYEKPHPFFTGSGDDSVLIDEGRFSTMEDCNKKINETLQYYKSKKTSLKPKKPNDIKYM